MAEVFLAGARYMGGSKNEKFKESYLLLTRDDRKISIIGGFLLMGLTLATGVAVYGVMRQQIESTLGRGLDVALQGKARLFESQIEAGLKDTRGVATRPFLVQSMQQLKVQPDSVSALRDLELNVNSLRLAGFAAATVYDMRGNELAQVGRFSWNQAPSLPLNSHNNTFLLWDGQFILRTSKGVLDQDGRRIGSITTEKNLPELTRSFSKIREIGKTGEFMLCAPPKEGGQEMACLLSQVDGVKFKHLSRMVGDEALPMNYALEGKNGVIAVSDYNQVPVIAAYAPLGTIGLGMVLMLGEEELFRPVTEQLKFIVLYLAGLIIAEVLLLYWLVRKLIRSEQEARDAKESAERFSTELSYKELVLRERLKEISCLYEIRRGMGLELSVDNVCQHIFKHLIPSMQFPEIATAIIELDGRQFTFKNHGQYLKHELQSKISVNDKVCGQLRVFYPIDKPFLVPEEQRLIDAIASDLERWLDRKRMEQALVSIAEENQRSIGQELHDNLGQQVAAIAYKAGALADKIFVSGNMDEATVATSIATQAQTAVMHIKRLAQGLLPFELEANGLLAALQEFSSRIAADYKITCNFTCKDEPLIADKSIALNLYRIVQEAVNNAIRHGGAQHLTILLTSEDGILRLSICDDGCGFTGISTEPGAAPGMGIKIMQYRAKQIGATLEFLLRAEGGTEVRLEMGEM